MSFLRRVVGAFGWKSKYIGRDLYGNRFYEYPSATDDSRRTRRIVKYVDKGKITEYATGGLRLPVQWSAWLSHTRSDPPSMEELRRDSERQRTVQHNAQILAIRDAQRSQIANGTTHSSEPQAAPSSTEPEASEAAHSTEQHRNPIPRKSFQGPPKPSTPDSEYKPRAWSPSISRRR